MPMSLNIAQYFRVALPTVLRSAGRRATELGVNVRFAVTGRGGGIWTLRLRPPQACVVPGAEWKADLEIRITSTEMHNILAGQFDPQQAMRHGNVEFSGELEILRKLGFLFQRLPDRHASNPLPIIHAPSPVQRVVPQP